MKNDAFCELCNREVEGSAYDYCHSFCYGCGSSAVDLCRE